MITIHHLGVSQSDRIIWLFEELDLPYDLKRYDRDPETQLAPQEYKALHPSGTAPVITEEDLVLAESGAIIEYVLDRHGNGRLVVGSDNPDYTNFLYWNHFVSASFAPSMMMLMAEGPIAKIMQERFFTNVQILEDHFAAGNTWLAGNVFTVADIMIAFSLTTALNFVSVDLAPYPNLSAYVERLTARPAYIRAMAKAEPA